MEMPTAPELRTATRAEMLGAIRAASNQADNALAHFERGADQWAVAFLSDARRLLDEAAAAYAVLAVEAQS